MGYKKARNRSDVFQTPSGNGSGAWFSSAWFSYGFNLPNNLNFIEL